MEPKTYKEALTQACWIEAVQEELHEFKRLEVWELVSRPDKVMSEGDKTDESDDDNDETVKAGSDKDDDDNDDEEELAKNDDKNTESGKGGDEVSESEGESDEEKTRQEKEKSFDPIPRTPEGSQDEGSNEEDQELRLSEEARIQEEEEADELYRDVNINQGRGLQVTQNIDDSHVTLTLVHPNGPQESSSVSSFVTSMLNPIRLQISQNPRGIFINQSKYALESLKKYGFESCDPVDTPMVEKSKLDEDREDTMADVNVNAPAEQAPAMAPPTCTDEQILPRSSWVHVGKSNCYLDVEKSQSNPIYKITVDILKHTNFFRPFNASSTIPSIYIQQFWDTVRYAERMWEEFTQSIHSFIEDKKNLALHTQGKKKSNPHVILSVSAKGTKREVFRMPIPNELITDDIRGGLYYNEYLEKVAKHQRYLAGEEGSDPDSPAPKPAKATKPKATKQSTPSIPKATPVTKPVTAKASKSTSSQQPKPAPPAPKPAPAKPQEKKRRLVKETSDEPSIAKRSKPSLDVHDTHRGPLPLVVFREPDSGRRQPLPEVQDKGEREDPTGPSTHHKDEKATRADVETDTEEQLTHTEKSGVEMSNTMVLGTVSGGQEGKQGGPDPGDSADSRPLPSQEILTDSSLDPEILEEPASSTGTLSSLQHLTKDFSFGDQFFNDKPSKAETRKTTEETKVESMVSITIQQDTFEIPPMTTSVIDLTFRPDSPNAHQPLPATATETTMTTTTTHPSPPQLQQSTTYSILIKRIGEIKQIMANLIQDNKHLEERLDSHGSCMYKLENLDIPQQVSKAVDEIVTGAVDWAIKAPLQNHFRDFPEADIKEILHQRMWETNSYQANEDHKNLYEKKRRHDSPKTPPGSPPHQPPPFPPPAGPSETSGSSGESGSSQVPPPHPPPQSTNQEDLHMDDDSAPDEQVHSSDNEDIRNDHIPKASALASTYAPPPENSLLAQTGDMATFMDWYCKQQGITELKQEDLEGPVMLLIHPP
nr:retrovirus-related Pol polyprotein from transposon TNT 1-94 [Tanacetum cinerariifolium]